MYCKRCGKFIDYQADVCNECAQAELGVQPVPAQAQPQAVEQEGSVTTGLGKSIAAVILGIFGFAFVYGALIVVSEMGMYADFDYGYGYASGVSYEALAAILMVFTMISVGLSIPSLIMSIASVKTFVNEKNAGRKKPIPTLIIGISGIVYSALAISLCTITFFLAFILMVA